MPHRSAYDGLFEYVERINRLNGGTSCALYAIQNDRIAAEYYAGKHSREASARRTSADSRYNVASVRKSYMGLAAAWALHEGTIESFDDPVLRYIPASARERPCLEGVTIRHLLTHTHGLDRDGEGRLTRRFVPGAGWLYNNEGVRFLSDLLPTVLGSPLSEWLREKIFDPLRWNETGWLTAPSDELVSVIEGEGESFFLEKSPDGAGGNLFVSARDLAYWGYLHLKLGGIGGRRIMPESVIRTAIAVQSPAELPATHPRNGCMWLVQDDGSDSEDNLIGGAIPTGSYEIVGLYGPLVLVVPELELVVVRMANKLGNYGDEQGTYADYLREFGNRAVEAARAAT